MKAWATCILCGLSLAGLQLLAQTAAAPAPGEVDVDPIDCSWRTSTAAVEVGERFTLTLTCGVIETDRNKVVVDPNQLDATALTLTPFEVLSGTRHEDVEAPPRRYFQYEYAVRIIGDGFFGQDVDIPRVTLKYTIQSSVGASKAESEGREQMYLLPALPMRVLSLVPPKAADIRDQSSGTFADMEARRRRASEELVAAAIAFGFAIVLLGLAFARMVGRFRKRQPVAVRPPAPAALLGACLRAVRRLRADVASDGWSPERAAQALAVFRVAAAVALGRPVAQLAVDADAPVREGQVPFTRGIFRSRNAMISAATSSRSVERQLATAKGRQAGVPDVMLEQFRESLQVFSTTRYGRSGELDTAALDAALENGAKAIRRLRLMNVWPMRTGGAASKAAAAAGAIMWLR